MAGGVQTRPPPGHVVSCYVKLYRPEFPELAEPTIFGKEGGGEHGRLITLRVSIGSVSWMAAASSMPLRFRSRTRRSWCIDQLRSAPIFASGTRCCRSSSAFPLLRFDKRGHG
jgi:hypothetical protein